MNPFSICLQNFPTQSQDEYSWLALVLRILESEFAADPTEVAVSNVASFVDTRLKTLPDGYARERARHLVRTQLLRQYGGHR